MLVDLSVRCAAPRRGRDIPRRAGDIPEPVGDAPRHRPGMSPLVGEITDVAGDIPERPGISPSGGRGYKGGGDIPDFFW